jgi:D-3-phosphoglycerate dehydrogenase / 2-oxoglutarate reductase
MKLVGVGELFIPHEHIKRGFAFLGAKGVSIETFDWKLSGFQELQNINHAVEKGGSEAYDPPDYIYEALHDADIMITEFCPVPRRLLDCSPDLKVVGVLRAGVENVNVARATERGVLVYNTPGRNSDSVADFTVGMLICESRNIARGHRGLKSGEWIREYPNSGRIPDLPGKTVGLVGLGEIGQKVARRLAGFDMRVLGADPFVKSPPPGVELVSLERLMAESDFVSIHARLTKDTEGLISKGLIASMKPTAYFINTSRSGLVDEQALYEALRDHRIEGAALDVFNKEPPGREYPLVALDNVTLTPHMAGGSNDAFFNSPARLAAEMAKLWDGEGSRFILNPEVFDRVAARFRS